ncbi:MAG: HDIG domain-containing protein [Spirochaetales bacterium]|nr:HDIG domain-containing protein [Spirochaetales bacterium]
MNNTNKNRFWRFLQRRETLLVLGGWLAASVLLIGVDQGRLWLERDQALAYEEGDRVINDFIVAQDYSIIDREATAKAQALSRSLVPPVYEVSGEITREILARFDRFAISVQPTGRETANSRENIRNEFPGVLALLERETSRDETKVLAMLQVTRDVLQEILLAGVFRLEDGDGGTASGVIEVVFPDQLPGRRLTLTRSAVVDSLNVEERLRQSERLKVLSRDDAEFVVALASFFIESNGYVNARLSQENRDAAAAATEPVVVYLENGTKLLEAGTIVSSRQAAILEALRSQLTTGYHGFVDPVFYMALLFTLGLVSGRIFGVSFDQTKTLLLFVVLGGLYLLLAALLIAFVPNRGGISPAEIMPTALCTLLLAQLLQDRRMALLSSMLMGLLIFFLTGENGHDFLITLASGIGGALSVKKRETRMGLLKAGPRLAAILGVFALFSGILMRLTLVEALRTAGWAAVNGLITGVLSLAFLPLLEHLLNTATTFRLIELSDQNVPILKRMRLQAPGTYIHSQNVAHLAEAACDAIGANGLLARVGAYYHDIGKVDQAHFFVENQKGENRHDEMKATLSVAVIKSHVKIGIEKARALRLPDEVMAVIEQHHGTSVIRYFYDRAMKEKGDEVNPEDFSYGGPKPRSREAAVVMLADSAEAATRTLKRPTAAKLEKYVWDLIMERFRSGELNESDLTLRDLETIKMTFVHVLTGHFHTRIEYPKDETEKS